MAAYNFEQIQTLMNYGFTADQIMELSRDSPSAANTNDTGDPPQLPPEDQPADPPEGDTPPDPAPDQPDSALNEIKAELQDLRAAVQKNNILTKSFEKVDESNTVEDILAGFIRPPMNGGK